jgi:hypothetical protein
VAVVVRELGQESLNTLSDPPEEQIDEVVHQLNGICRSSSLEFALRVGAVIIHHFYNGDTEAWRTRGPKLNSFRRLSRHPDLALSAGALYRCVAIFEMCDRLRAASRWRRLGASHLRAVIGVPSGQQEHLLDRANDERWTVQVLQTKARHLRSGAVRGGRRAQSALDKQLRTLDRCVRQDWRRALDRVGQDDVENLARIQHLLGRMKTSIEDLADEVQARRDRLIGTESCSAMPATTASDGRESDRGSPGREKSMCLVGRDSKLASLVDDRGPLV